MSTIAPGDLRVEMRHFTDVPHGASHQTLSVTGGKGSVARRERRSDVNLNPTLTYELAVARTDAIAAASTGGAPMLVDRANGWLRRALGLGLISMGERLAGSEAVSPVAGTP